MKVGDLVRWISNKNYCLWCAVPYDSSGTKCPHCYAMRCFGIVIRVSKDNKFATVRFPNITICEPCGSFKVLNNNEKIKDH